MQREVEEGENCVSFSPPLFLLPNLAQEEIVWGDKEGGGGATQLWRIWLRHRMTQCFVVGLIVRLLRSGPLSVFPSFHF